MSVAFDLDFLSAPAAAPAGRPGLRVVPREVPHDAPREAPLGIPGARSAGLASVSVLHAPSPSAAAAPLRLTHRGIAVLAVLTAALGAVLVWAAARSAPSAAAPAAPVPATITVRAGDTLWALAARVAPQRDPRAEVAELRRLNHLSDPALIPGQTLRVR